MLIDSNWIEEGAIVGLKQIVRIRPKARTLNYR